MSTNADITLRMYRIALEAARESQEGSTTYRPNTKYPQNFNLKAGGLCLRFVRQVTEVAAGLGEGTWHYAMPKAKQALRMMEADGLQVGNKHTSPSELKIGDIIGITTGVYGHIAIFMGLIDGIHTVAENTSSASRGKPMRAGTKLTPYSALQNRVTGIFRLYPTEEKKVKVTIVEQDKKINIPAKLIDNVIYVPVRNLANALGHEVNYDNKSGEVVVQK